MTNLLSTVSPGNNFIPSVFAKFSNFIALSNSVLLIPLKDFSVSCAAVDGPNNLPVAIAKGKVTPVAVRGLPDALSTVS